MIGLAIFIMCGSVIMGFCVCIVVTWEEDKTAKLRKQLESLGRCIRRIIVAAGSGFWKIIVVIRGWINEDPQGAAVPWDIYLAGIIRELLWRLQDSGSYRLLIPDNAASLGQSVRAAGRLPSGAYYYVITISRVDVSRVFTLEDCKVMEVVLASICTQWGDSGLTIESIRPADAQCRRLDFTFRLCTTQEERCGIINNLLTQFEQSTLPAEYEIPTADVNASGKVALYDADQLQRGIQTGIPIEQAFSLLVAGKSGSGKTTFLKSLLPAIAARAESEGKRTRWLLVDYKSEFPEHAGQDYYFGPDKAEEGIAEAYRLFEEVRSHPEEHRDETLTIVFDEYAAMLDALPKKDADECRKQLASILRLNRSLGVKVILGMQDPSAQIFGSTGPRDQFNGTLVLGTQSPEATRMLFPNDKDRIQPVTHPGEGYLRWNDAFYHVQAPFVMSTSSNGGAPGTK